MTPLMLIKIDPLCKALQFCLALKSITADTLFPAAKILLVKWFWTMYLTDSLSRLKLIDKFKPDVVTL